MKDKICATLTKDHIYICDGGVIGRSGENECTQLEITLDECLCDKWVYIDFIKPDGTTYKTSKLDIVNNKVVYDIPNALLDQKGTLKVQVVLQNEEGEIWKSTIKTYGVNPSINATDEIENKDDFITEAQRLLNEVEEGLTPTIGDNGNWFILDKDTGKTSKGDKGEKGDKGDAGSIKFIIVNELPTEDIDESAIYMKRVESEDTQNSYEEYIYVNGVWELLGIAQVQVDLTDYVKNTDFATEGKAGIVKVSSSYGIRMINNTLDMMPAQYTVIDARKPNETPLYTANGSTRQGIVPANLDYAVKKTFTDNKLVDTKYDWTDEEKASARKLIGASTEITLTQAEYDALETKDENTYYYIVEE